MLVAFCSCSSKQGPIDDLEELATELTENSENYNQEDWENAATQFSEIEKELQNYEYTDEELKQIGKLKAKCGRAMMKSAVKSTKSMIHDFKMQMEGAAEEMESMSEEFLDIFGDEE